jgi:predicted signal transduction protein with EAL and GGDEF domain
LSRLGGDEFAIVQRTCRSLSDATTLAARCIEKLTQPFEIAGNDISIGVSIGIVFDSRQNTDIEKILQQADLALYKAKREGRNCYRVYERGMNDPLRLRNELENDIRQALTEDQFELHYQPIVNADTGETTACEALLRWKHKVRGNVPPAEFIPVAEERGLMPELGAWVLMRACRDAAKWPPGVRLEVNVSPAQLLFDNFVAVLAHALKTSRLPAERLEIEITETALLDKSGTPSRILKSIRELGVGVAMDDFGTGYSSLSMLQSFPFTRVKIDRSFIHGLGHNPKSTAIVRSILSLCDSLGIGIIAEGVETQAQRDALVEQQCGEIQGFLISVPVASHDLATWFKGDARLHGRLH